MSELQTDSVESEVIEPAVIENPDDGADLAAASESEHSTNPEPVDEVESEASKQQKYINTQYGQIKQGERDLAKANDQLAKFQSDERERQSAAVGNIPPMPDAFDDDFDVKLKQRDEAIIAKANFNAQNNAYIQQQQFTQQQAAQAAQQKQTELGNSFTANANAAGATDEEFNTVVTTLNNGGMTGDIGNAIMQDPDGYFIAKHLAANTVEANELSSMNPILAGAKYAELKVKASALKPKISSTPAPATNLQGGGVDPEAGKYQHIKGAKFE